MPNALLSEAETRLVISALKTAQAEACSPSFVDDAEYLIEKLRFQLGDIQRVRSREELCRDMHGY